MKQKALAYMLWLWPGPGRTNKFNLSSLVIDLREVSWKEFGRRRVTCCKEFEMILDVPMKSTREF